MNKPIRDVQVTVPVLGPGTAKSRAPLMPCHPARARQLKKKGAEGKWFKGIYAIQLNYQPVSNLQRIVCGLDTGIFYEAFTIQSIHHTFINILSDGINHIHKKLKIRKYRRRFRRKRKTPCRAPRSHRKPKKNWIAPSIRARWEARLRIIQFIKKLYPITEYVIEDVAARKFVKMKKWNKSFSNLEMGKTFYYNKIFSLGNLVLKRGYETAKHREELKLKKLSSKSSEKFYSHNVDSWTLASFVTGKKIVDNENVFRMVSLKPIRRQLFVFSFQKGHLKKKYGGTISLGFKKGSFVTHKRYGLLMVGGANNKGLSLHNPNSGEVERFNGVPENYKFLYYSGWRTYWVNNIIKVPKTEFIGGHSLRDPNIREKGRQTKKELYGNPNFTNRKKAKQTCLEKYGYAGVGKVPEFIQKRIKTSLERYGRVFNYEYVPPFTKEDLIDLHVNKGMTLKEIGQKYNLTAEGISYWMKKFNIPTHKKIVVSHDRIILSPVEIIELYFQACFENNKVLSFSEFGKLKGDKNNTKIKRLFNKGKKFNSLRDELFSVALDMERQKEFLKEIQV